MEHALHHTKGIERRCQNTESRNDSDPDADLIRAQQDQELADKVPEAWQAQRSQGEEERCSAETWDGGPQTTHPFHVASVSAFLERADQNKQRARAQAVTDHCHDRALEAE